MEAALASLDRPGVLVDLADLELKSAALQILVKRLVGADRPYGGGFGRPLGGVVLFGLRHRGLPSR